MRLKLNHSAVKLQSASEKIQQNVGLNKVSFRKRGDIGLVS